MSTRPSQANMLQRLLSFFFSPHRRSGFLVSSSLFFTVFVFFPLWHPHSIKPVIQFVGSPSCAWCSTLLLHFFVQTSAASRCAVPWILCPDKLVKCTTMSSGGKKICLAWEGKCDTFLSDFLLKTIVCKKNYGTSCLHELQGSLSRARRDLIKTKLLRCFPTSGTHVKIS